MIEVILVTSVHIQNKRNGVRSVARGTRADGITHCCVVNREKGQIWENCGSRIVVNILIDRALGSGKGYICSSSSKTKMAVQCVFGDAEAVFPANGHYVRLRRTSICY
jgi:hypothetical protein